MVDNKIIEEEIRRAEAGTSGEIRVHVKAECPQDALAEAQKVFKKLGMHDTKLKNGVLIFVAYKSHRFAIVGDEALHAKVGEDFWETTRDEMAGFFAKGDITGGIVAGVKDIGARLKEHFPADKINPNELPDKVSGER